MRKRIWIGCAAITILVLTLSWHLLPGVFGSDQDASPVDAEQTQRWIDENPERQVAFAEFTAFLESEGVGNVVEPMTLLRTDRPRGRDCDGDLLAIPPRANWSQIVPTLELVRDVVIPAIGEVEVVSSYREPAMNQCAGGAEGSRHLSFAALDLVPRQQETAQETFATLCDTWREAGPASRWGFGAYFDSARPEANRRARFHVDATGWRTWGANYRNESSGCHQL